MSAKTYIFGYGSLVVPEDIYVTLGRQVEVLYPFVLQGWLRDWSAVIENHRMQRRFTVHEDGSVPEHIVVLNVRRPLPGEAATHPNGVLFEVSAADLAMLDARESHYARVDITPHVQNAPAGVIYTYTALPAYTLSPDDVRQVVVPGSYATLVSGGFTALGDDMHAVYAATTQPHRHAVANTALKA